MSSLNRVILIGRLTHDPEIRYTPSGKPVTNFTLAVTTYFKTATGERKENTDYIKIVVFGRNAETCSQYLGKGRLVAIEGRLATRSFEDATGNKRRVVEVVAHTVKFLDTKKEMGPTAGVEPEVEESTEPEFEEIPF